MKKHIPNAITCCNLLCGCTATYLAFGGRPELAGAFILLAAVFDFFDGWSARKLGVSSPIGKELDSLADVISFGFAPSAMLFHSLREVTLFPRIACFAAFLIAAFSALRLAKFNLDERQTCGFIGMPTPANALLLTGLCCSPLLAYAGCHWPLPVFLIATFALIGALCWLLVCEIPMFSFKAGGKTAWVFAAAAIVITLACLVLWHDARGLFLSMLLYIVICLTEAAYAEKRKA